MRPYGLVLVALMLASRPASAQQAQAPAAPPAAPPAEDKVLDGYLQKWEAKMKDVTALGAQLMRVDKDRTFDTVTKLVGEAWYMKDGKGPTALNLAILQMRPEGKKPEEFQEKYVCTGTYLYDFRPAQKELRVYELPKPKPGQVAEDNLLSLLFGMKAEDAKHRYSLKLAKEDQYYIYVDITPRLRADQADFRHALLVLDKNNFLPRQLRFEHANGNEVMWDMPNVRTDIKLDRRAFDAPKPPEGWKLVPVNRESQTQPRTVRPLGP
jgi:TIGR03009 family protein